MILYHGTTARRAQRISAEGFVPKKPSRRVWFSEGRGYALGRAKTQARRRHDRPVVLVCEVDLSRLRARFGPKRLLHRNGVVAVNGTVPVTVLRSFRGLEVPASLRDLASWVNGILGLKPYKGVGPRHPGILRLSRWVAHRLAFQPGSKLRPAELLHMARQWLPEFFVGVEVDLQRLRAVRRYTTIEVRAEPVPAPGDTREEEALDCLGDPKPGKRARGLSILAELADPDLFDWCVMFLEDEALSVRLAALQTMLRCEEGDAEVIEPFAESSNKRIRGAAIAALARHSGRDAPRWFRRGLKDSQACVRVQTAALLSQLDPGRHRAIFELALYDPNPDVSRAARKLTAKKGYGKPKW